MNQIIEALEMLKEDGVSKNVCKCIDELVSFLKSDAELTLKKDKALNVLGNASNDPNLPGDVRTQMWNILSMLEAS
jgi:uncharacterized protein (UPF0147 family)